MTSIMASKKSKACMINDARDRLSELPDEILVHILSFLPLLDAVRTVSIRRFGCLWTLLPSLKFEDYQHFMSANRLTGTIDSDGSIDSDDEISCAEQIRRFAKFVRNVLMIHKGFPVNKLLLHLENIDLELDHQGIIDLDIWIKFAIDRQLKELKVQFNVCWCYILPQCVFKSQFLVKLKLSMCEIEGLSRVQMGSLRILSLKFVKVSNEMFKKIIDGCPSLQELDLRCVADLYEVRFNAPNIVKLELYYCGIRVLDCPNLKILVMYTYRSKVSILQVLNISSVREVHINSIQHIDKICKAEVVKFSYGAFSGLNFKELNIPQTRWKCLNINSRFNEDHQFIDFCRLLRSSPHLEELIVYLFSLQNLPSKPVKTHDYPMLSEELSSPSVFPQLKTVTMRCYELPCQGLLQLVKFLLKSCVNLENMVILPSTFDLVEEHKILKQLCSIPRASANARVICDSK